jgi:hypothetical protein
VTTDTTENDVLDKLQQSDTMLQAVTSIMSVPPAGWTREQQAKLIWTTLGLAFQMGVVDGGESMKAAILSGFGK